MTSLAFAELILAAATARDRFTGMAALENHPAELTCSDCHDSIPMGSGHYEIDFDIRQMGGRSIEVEQSATTSLLCPRCSLRYDLTRLNVPTTDGWYSYEPLEDGYADCCSICERMIAVGEQFQAALILPVEIESEQDGPTVAIALCGECASQRALHLARPPNADAPPYCFQCGKYTGYTGGIFDRPELYVAHPTAWRDAAPSEVVRLCDACVLEDSQH